RLPRSPRAPRPPREHFPSGRSAPPPPCLAGPPGSHGDRRPLVPGQDRGRQRDPDSAVRLDSLQSTIQREDRVARNRVRVSSKICDRVALIATWPGRAPVLFSFSCETGGNSPCTDGSVGVRQPV